LETNRATLNSKMKDKADGLPGRRHPRPIPEGDWGRDLTAGGRAAQKGGQRGRRGEKTGGVPSGAHGATNKEHQVCARRRVGEAAGSPLRILSSRERRSGKGVSLGEEAVLADSGRAGEIAAGAGRVEC
jgi:hypothetical protein